MDVIRHVRCKINTQQFAAVGVEFARVYGEQDMSQVFAHETVARVHLGKYYGIYVRVLSRNTKWMQYVLTLKI